MSFGVWVCSESLRITWTPRLVDVSILPKRDLQLSNIQECCSVLLGKSVHSTFVWFWNETNSWFHTLHQVWLLFDILSCPHNHASAAFQKLSLWPHRYKRSEENPPERLDHFRFKYPKMPQFTGTWVLMRPQKLGPIAALQNHLFEAIAHSLVVSTHLTFINSSKWEYSPNFQGACFLNIEKLEPWPRIGRVSLSPHIASPSASTAVSLRSLADRLLITRSDMGDIEWNGSSADWSSRLGAPCLKHTQHPGWSRKKLTFFKGHPSKK